MDGSFGAPANWYELLIMPALAVFFGLLLRFLGWNQSRQGKKSPTWTWMAVAVLALGAYVVFKVMWHLFDPELSAFYRNTIWSGKVLASHYLAFGLPVLALIAVLVWNLAEKKLGRPIAV